MCFIERSLRPHRAVDFWALASQSEGIVRPYANDLYFSWSDRTVPVGVMLRKPALLPFSRGISSQDDSGVIRICCGETAFRSGRNIRVGAGDVLSSFHWHVSPSVEL
ncbi:hypothetical protein [Phocaeicola coprophilus]|uniref:hypothetical protein n=1 Tax=Phocaeicola coprophilus TaxID=387090 RepID=UPI00242DFD76|nr:hypothetical protein [Phocaeicola coprophilus]